MKSLQHLHLYAYPALAQPGPSRSIEGRQLVTVVCGEELASSQFELSFEQAVELLAGLPRMFIELDGSFVWSGSQSESPWQIDGMLYDRDGHVRRVELKGHCPPAAWQQMLVALGWPQQALLAHLLEHHCFVEMNALLEFFHEL